MPKTTLKRSVFYLTLICAGLLVGAGASEAVLRIFSNRYFHGGYLPESLVVDEELGFRPAFDQKTYSSFGTLVNNYPANKDERKTRILVLGDSVVARGDISKRICEKLGAQFECWNGGVAGYNTAQELIYLQRYLMSITPDEIILFFHLNDFYVSPAIASDASNKLLAFIPGTKSIELNRFLFLNSYLYQMLSRARFPTFSRAESKEIVRRSLQEMLSFTSQKRFRVAVMPYFKKTREWTESERTDRNDILHILRESSIRHLDLYPTLLAAEESGVEIQKTPGDFWHPSAQFESLMVDYLSESSFLDFN